eukprot:scaffold5855_cov117-Isochrysis_galbana.AAC.17
MARPPPPLSGPIPACPAPAAPDRGSPRPYLLPRLPWPNLATTCSPCVRRPPWARCGPRASRTACAPSPLLPGGCHQVWKSQPSPLRIHMWRRRGKSICQGKPSPPGSSLLFMIVGVVPSSRCPVVGTTLQFHYEEPSSSATPAQTPHSVSAYAA